MRIKKADDWLICLKEDGGRLVTAAGSTSTAKKMTDECYRIDGKSSSLLFFFFFHHFCNRSNMKNDENKSTAEEGKVPLQVLTLLMSSIWGHQCQAGTPASQFGVRIGTEYAKVHFACLEKFYANRQKNLHFLAPSDFCISRFTHDGPCIDKMAFYPKPGYFYRICHPSVYFPPVKPKPKSDELV